MGEILITWASLTAAVWVAAGLLPSMQIRGGIKNHLAVGASYGLLMLITGWTFHLLLGVFGLGLSFLSGFVGRVLVGAVALELASATSQRVRVKGFGTALVASLLISIVGSGVEVLARSA